MLSAVIFDDLIFLYIFLKIGFFFFFENIHFALFHGAHKIKEKRAFSFFNKGSWEWEKM